MDGSILLSNTAEDEEDGINTYYTILEKSKLHNEKIYRNDRKPK